MKYVPISVARSTLPRLIARAQGGEEIVLTRRNVPVAKIVPYRAAAPKRQFGALRGKITIGAEFFDP
jgi:prevent-host-death family protein